ncbi:MAG: hypothetical protein K2N88_00225 [Muribaculaceae bacterium]|nr:hypothetical protein [Muribaculaceae bacterium]
MKEEEKIIARFGRKGPWSVPEGYFDSLSQEIAAKLPEMPEAEKPAKLTPWQRVKPYAYLAAMFAGIWCMMQMFHHISGVGTLSLDNPPEHIAALMADEDAEVSYSLPSAFSDAELIEEISSQYSDIDQFKEDFGVEIESKYND